ncbi:hypothetical protein PSA01_15140 [Pseudonocardia saturnea]|uniref:Uncharacterized protein n=1 Tax=Pseudonocardia saturnea TaxID=33909 RepID=A0ABQ0RUY4_9PSEU|nr:hypothetical protein PSA01_15140 [Pseudonocardia saturnea]
MLPAAGWVMVPAGSVVGAAGRAGDRRCGWAGDRCCESGGGVVLVVGVAPVGLRIGGRAR